jgi:hypothetical protein
VVKRCLPLLVCVAFAGCGSAHTASTSTLATCRAENETIHAEDRAIEQHNREGGPIRLIKILKLCVPGTAPAPRPHRSETQAVLEQQAAAGQIQQAKIVKRIRIADLTLRDGQHLTAQYGKHEEPTVVADLEAHSVTVVVAP